MPIFYQQDIDEDTKLGIWKIEEDEDFFLQSVVPQRNVSHPHKKLQHLAGRYLLKYLFPDFPLSLILIADTRKPYLENEAYHFSISHCGDYAAAIVSKTKRVGIDIEIATEKVERIRNKFLSQEEMAIGNGQWAVDLDELVVGKEQSAKANEQKENDPTMPLTIFWSCKEAVFKWYGLGEVDFKQHIVIEGIKKTDKLFETAIVFRKKEDRSLLLQSVFFENNLCLSYVVT